jgi:hypothetical protein
MKPTVTDSVTISERIKLIIMAYIMKTDRSHEDIP